nr:hypothetical protein HmN_000901100 [Hymenolepis microstoma]CUU97905.1 hypothetical transcript [Hymenolepis microstoma]
MVDNTPRFENLRNVFRTNKKVFSLTAVRLSLLSQLLISSGARPFSKSAELRGLLTLQSPQNTSLTSITPRYIFIRSINASVVISCTSIQLECVEWPTSLKY